MMLDKAIKKIKDEMAKDKNPYVNVIGEFLLNHLNINPGAAEKILDDKKSIIKSLDEMKNAAEKKKVGNCAVLTDQEGFEIVLKYYGIESSESKGVPIAQEVKEKVEVKKEESSKKVIDFDVKLEDFI